MNRLYILAELPGGPAQALAAHRDNAWAGWHDFGWHYGPRVLRFLGRKWEATAASRQLREQDAPVPTWMPEWYRHLLDYDCGVISAEQLLEIAGTSRWRLVEAHFAIGIDLLSSGDRRGAAEHFQRCTDTYVLEYTEYKWGRAFLERLQQDPTWPPWIPMKEDPAARPATAPRRQEP